VAVREGGTLNYLLTDHLGSVNMVISDAGSVLSEQRYLPFGGVRGDVGSIPPTLQPLDILRLSLDKPPETYLRREGLSLRERALFFPSSPASRQNARFTLRIHANLRKTGHSPCPSVSFPFFV
jgi:hypothetical protein